MLNEYGRIGNARSRSRRIIVSSLLLLLFVLAVVAVSASSQTARPRVRNDIPLDGEQWIKVDSGRHVLLPNEGMMSLTEAEKDSILRDSRECKPANAPAPYCNPRDAELFTPEVIRQMVGTQ